MRLVDMLFFQAEHDDYHLARISELKKLLAKNYKTRHLLEQNLDAQSILVAD